LEFFGQTGLSALAQARSHFFVGLSFTRFPLVVGRLVFEVCEGSVLPVRVSVHTYFARWEWVQKIGDFIFCCG